MTGLIVDASVAIKWLVEENGSDHADALQGRDMLAPWLLRIEAANTLWKIGLREKLPRSQVLDLMDLLHTAPVRLTDADDTLERRALEIAIDLGHPAYDCLYLALAERTGRTLVTADEKLLRKLSRTAFEPLAISLEDAARAAG